MSDDTPNEKKLTAYERWELPNLESSQPVKVDKPSALAIKVEDEAVEVTEEIDEESLVYEPLTAQQLEEIRSAAYDEGYDQGQEEGHQKGYEEGLESGYQEGLPKGIEQGLAEGKMEAEAKGIELAKTQLSELEQLLNTVVGEFEKPLEESRAAMEELLRQTVKRLAEHVVRRELSEESNSLITEELDKVLTTLGESEGRATLTVHPHSLETVQALASDTRLHIKIKTDETLLEGGFILDSHHFYVDGRIESRLDDVLKSLEKANH